MPAPAYSSFANIGNATTSPRSFSGVTVAVGDLLAVAIVSASTGGPNAYSLSDSLGHTWTRVTDASASGLSGRSVEWWWAVAMTAGTCILTVTATGGISWMGGLVRALAVSGATTTYDTAAVATNGTNTTSHPCAPAGQIDTAADVIVLAACATSGNIGTLTDPTGFTLRGTLLNSRVHVWTRESASALTDERAQWTSANSMQSLGSVVSFKAATVGGFAPAGARGCNQFVGPGVLAC